jgi:hypothetical protein
MPDPHLRASDTDREAVAGVLGRALSDGRLTVDEYEDRLTRAYAARTYGDLEGLTTDLPPAEPVARPAPAPAARPMPYGPPTPPRIRTHGAVGLRAIWGSWLRVALIVTAIWLATTVGSHHVQPFWPVWVIVPWGAVLLGRTLRGGPPQSRCR